MKQHQKKAAGFIAVFFSAIVLLISATTSFGFFFTYFAELIPAGVLDSFTSAMISGFVGVLLFDLACAIWLYTFLHHAMTPEQRAISLIMTIITFLGAAAASVAYLLLTASGELAMAAETRRTVADGALIVVIAGVVINFGAAQAYHRYSQENKEAVREADRLDRILVEQEKHESYFDELVAGDVKSILQEMAPQMAKEKAAAVAAEWRRREEATLGNFDGSVQPGLAARGRRQSLGFPTGQPKRERVDAIGGRRPSVKQAQADRIALQPADPAASPAPPDNATLMIDGGQWVMSWVDSNDGQGYARPIQLPDDAAAAWREANQRGIVPAGMTRDTFNRLHQKRSSSQPDANSRSINDNGAHDVNF